MSKLLNPRQVKVILERNIEVLKTGIVVDLSRHLTLKDLWNAYCIMVGAVRDDGKEVTKFCGFSRMKFSKYFVEELGEPKRLRVGEGDMKLMGWDGYALDLNKLADKAIPLQEEASGQ